ncbi:MAG: cation diffusion facilitator family transporter [Panacagrimonas sp.]
MTSRPVSHASDNSAANLARWSIVAALATMALKFGAWGMTGSVGLLSDAMESVVNLGAAIMAVSMLRLAAMPPDQTHAYGHGKAEYFAAAFEGGLIALAALSIFLTAWPRLFAPQVLTQTGLGLGICAVAGLINGLTALALLRGARQHRSLALEADARHLLTDVWTSVGIIAGVALATLTGWLILDPLIALAVAVNILLTGLRLLRESARGLMDAAWSPAEQQQLAQILDAFRSEQVDFHAVRTRRAGARRFVSFHVLVPGHWSVQKGHDLLEAIESRLAEALSPVSVLTHLEPIEDPRSHADQDLDRAPSDDGSNSPETD